MRKLVFVVVSMAALALAQPVRACMPAPFGPEGAVVERTGESRAFIAWDGLTETLVIDPQLRGTASEFGLALAFPGRPEVREAPKELFAELAEHTKPRERPRPPTRGEGAAPSTVGSVEALPPVEVLEVKEVAEFTVSILTATDAQALVGWLREHGYAFTAADVENFDYYVRRGGSYFAALKINPQRAGDIGEGYGLSPIEFEFPALVEPVLPLRLARDDDPKQELTLYTLGEKPLVVYGAQLLYNQTIASAIETPASLERYAPSGSKWLSRMTFTVDPPRIAEDLTLASWWRDPQPIHVYEDEVSQAISPDLRQLEAGIVAPPTEAGVLDVTAEESDIGWEEAGAGIGFGLVFFFYLAFALRSLAKRHGVGRRWRAWLPLAQWALLVEIAGKHRVWFWFIFKPTVLILILAVIDTVGLPEWVKILWAVVTALSFFLWQIMLVLAIAAIARRQGRRWPVLLGLVTAFAQPLGAIILGVLAWGKAGSPPVLVRMVR